jgi:hypothetical protein
MSFSRYQKPTSANIVYKDSHAVLAPEQLIVLSNKYKLLYNNNGTLEWMGFNGANLPLKLDGSALISSQYLPSYVDDVQEYNSFANFPTVGETGKIYVDISGSNKVYRWSGTSYFLITDLTNYYTKAEINTTTTTLQTNITNEITNRTNADTTLTTNLNNEITNRTNADTTLTTNLNNEITNRTDADTALSNRITPLETLKTNADASFTLTGANVVLSKNIDMNTHTLTNCPTISTLTSDLASEVTNRTNAVSGEASTRSSADTALSTRITPLETLKTNADASFTLSGSNVVLAKNIDMGTKTITNCPTLTTITTDISTEITNRTNADSSLQTQINTTNTNAFTKNATGTQTINSSIDCNGGSVTNSNIMQCGSLRTGSLNAQAGTYISSVVTTGLEFNYGKNIVLDANRSGRETNSTVISANHTDATDSLVIFGKGDTVNTRRMYLEDIVTVRLQLNVPTLNTKTCDGLHRLTRPDIFTDVASVTGVNFFEYASLSGYKIYHVQWFVGTAPQFSGWSLSTDGTYTSINVSMTSGQTIRCLVLMCQN